MQGRQFVEWGVDEIFKECELFGVNMVMLRFFNDLNLGIVNLFIV